MNEIASSISLVANECKDKAIPLAFVVAKARLKALPYELQTS